MTSAPAHVTDLIFGRWRSQTLYTGVELGIFEIVSERPKHAVEIADQLDLDRDRSYRLLRALSSLGLLEEIGDKRFVVTAAGELLQEDHPKSLRGVARLEEGPTHYEIWKHLPDIVREGTPDGFHREFGHSFIEHTEADSEYGARFNAGMSSLSKIESGWVATLLDDVELSTFDHVCDVGGGHGHLLCTLLQETEGTTGSVLELSGVVESTDEHWHEPMDLADRVDFIAGDFFEEVPRADGCIEILSTMRDSAPEGASVFNCELVVPGADEPHLGKLFDIHMMVVSSGRERTEAEYGELYDEAGFELVETHDHPEIPMSVVEGRAV